jgi:hypothetical protein
LAQSPKSKGQQCKGHSKVVPIKRSQLVLKRFPDSAALKELDVFGQGKLKWLYLFMRAKLIKEGRISHFRKKTIK